MSGVQKCARLHKLVGSILERLEAPTHEIELASSHRILASRLPVADSPDNARYADAMTGQKERCLIDGTYPLSRSRRRATLV